MSFLNIISHGGNAKAAQHARTLPAARGSGIKRGSLIKISSGAFVLAQAADATANTEPGDLYLSLHDVSAENDPLAAGAVGDGSDPTATNFGTLGLDGTIGGSQALTAATAKVTGVPIVCGVEVQTDQFTGTPAAGAYLCPGADGVVRTHPGASNGLSYNVVGMVTGGVVDRPVNNEASVPDYATAFKILYTLTYRTMFVPQKAIANVAPVVDAGPDDSVTLPATYQLAGTATDANSGPDPLTHLWTKVSGPGTVTFDDATALAAVATFSVDGTYVLRLTSTDGVASTSDNVTITVNP